MKICYFCLFLVLNFLNFIKCEDVTFRAKEVDTLVMFTYDAGGGNIHNITGFINYFSSFMSFWKGHEFSDFTNLPVQLWFGNYNATELLQAADVENNTAAMVVLSNNDEFMQNITQEIPGFQPGPLFPCVNDLDNRNYSGFCDQVDFFLNEEKYHTKLTKLNLLIFSNVCPDPFAFNEFLNYGRTLINNNTNPTPAYLITMQNNCSNLVPYNVKILYPNETAYGAVDDNIVRDFMDPRFSAIQMNPMLNFFNFFVAVAEENYNTSIDFMVNYIHNSQICGHGTNYTSSAFAYYIFMRVKYRDDFNTERYKAITTMVPWIDFEEQKIDFAEYLKQNLDYQLSLKAYDKDSYQAEIQQQMTNIFVSGNLRQKPTPNNHTQFTIFFTDEFLPWVKNNYFYTNQEGRILDIVLYGTDISENASDTYKTQFYNQWFPTQPAINMVIINSTDPDESPYVAVCKQEVELREYPFRHLSPPLQWYYWVIIGVAILAIVIIAANVLYWKFLRPKDPIDMIAQNFKLNEEEKKLFSNARDKLYIDEAMVEVDYNVILGRGASSTVYKAIIKGIAPSLRPKKELESAVSEDYIVAAKVSNQFGREQIEELIGEIEAARCLENHPNICAMLGWSTHLGAPCLLFESMELDLLSYIKSLRIESIDTTSETDSVSLTSIAISEHYSVPDFDENQCKIFLQILWQATKGLEYIASKNIVHRDVAARNFLLSRNGNTFTAKIADFGLCSNVDENTNVYRSSLNKRLPIKWLAIESLVDRTFSQASDVWAFGVTMIEMYSCANELYPGIGLNEVTDYLKNGNRMEKPEKMPQEMYDIAFSCWKEDPAGRPTFLDLRDQFETILRGMGVDDGYLGINENDQEEFDAKSIAF